MHNFPKFGGKRCIIKANVTRRRSAVQALAPAVAGKPRPGDRFSGLSAVACARKRKREGGTQRAEIYKIQSTILFKSSKASLHASSGTESLQRKTSTKRDLGATRYVMHPTPFYEVASCATSCIYCIVRNCKLSNEPTLKLRNIIN